jgi:hypothetical protein
VSFSAVVKLPYSLGCHIRWDVNRVVAAECCIILHVIVVRQLRPSSHQFLSPHFHIYSGHAIFSSAARHSPHLPIERLLCRTSFFCSSALLLFRLVENLMKCGSWAELATLRWKSNQKMIPIFPLFHHLHVAAV